MLAKRQNLAAQIIKMYVRSARDQTLAVVTGNSLGMIGHEIYCKGLPGVPDQHRVFAKRDTLGERALPTPATEEMSMMGLGGRAPRQRALRTSRPPRTKADPRRRGIVIVTCQQCPGLQGHDASSPEASWTRGVGTAAEEDEGRAVRAHVTFTEGASSTPAARFARTCMEDE
ncbi:hypothetical protein VTO73DRAFT_5422 [Trametes versicolor]